MNWVKNIETQGFIEKMPTEEQNHLQVVDYLVFALMLTISGDLQFFWNPFHT